MNWQPPIPKELWDQVPPAAQAALLALFLQYEQQLRSLPGRSTAAGPPPLPYAADQIDATSSETSPLADLTGKTISHFELGPMLAAGNTGAIFRAKDTTKPGRRVAFQMIRQELYKEDDKDRFVKTMSAVRGLRHPTLVRVYAAGKNGPNFWIAMKFIDGESLASRLQRMGVAGRLDWRTTYTVAVSLTRALDVVHKAGMLHRNLKPANVMVRAADRKALLGDFSRARPISGARVEPLPWPGQLAADLPYLSPEQTQPGRVEDVRCDLYGLGATLYTLLAGRPPFEAGTIDKMVEKIRGEEPPRPKEFQLAIPEGLEGLVIRLLAKRVDVRFQSATEALKELERVSKIQQLPFDPDEGE
jgi:eukaryotic-like serine/threonine-protein kinase